MAEHDLVDVLGGETGIGQRFARDLDDEAFDGFVGELAERCVGPTHDAGGHDVSLIASLIWLCRIFGGFSSGFPKA